MISDEQVGVLLASQARCEEGHRRIAREMEQMREEARAERAALRKAFEAALSSVDSRSTKIEEDQAEIKEREQRRTGIVLALRVVGGLVLAGASVASGWAVNAMSAQADQVEEHGAKIIHLEAQVERVQSDLSVHEARGGPQGHPESVLDRVRTLEGRQSTLEATQAAQTRMLEEVHARVVLGRRR